MESLPIRIKDEAVYHGFSVVSGLRYGTHIPIIVVTIVAA